MSLGHKIIKVNLLVSRFIYFASKVHGSSYQNVVELLLEFYLMKLPVPSSLSIIMVMKISSTLH